MDATTKQQRTHEHVRAWKQVNRDKVLAQKKRYRKRHRAEIQESKKLYAAGHWPQINEYRCRYRKAKKCARELQAQHQLLVPSGTLSVSETAKDLLTEARARLASREATSSGGFFFLLATCYLFLFLSLNAFIFFFHSPRHRDSLFTARTGSVQRQRQARDREANRERIRGRKRAYYQANKARLREYKRRYRESHREQIREYGHRYRQTHLEQLRECDRRNYYTRRRRQVGSCLLEGLGTDARPSHVIDTAGGGWLVRKYGFRPPTPPYLREGLARVDCLAPPASPSLSSDLSDAANRLDELLLRASPTGSSSIASDVVAELNDLVPPRPEPERRSTRLAQWPRLPPAAPEEDEEPVVDAAQIVLRRVRSNRARSQA